MEIHERIILLRKELLSKKIGKKLSQSEFAKKMGVSRDVIGNIEYNRVELKEHMIKLICKTFNVNENWLRYGKEPIFLEDDATDLISKLKQKYDLDDLTITLLNTFINLDDMAKKTIVNFILASIENYYINNPSKLKELNNKILSFQDICVSNEDLQYKIFENDTEINLIAKGEGSSKVPPPKEDPRKYFNPD